MFVLTGTKQKEKRIAMFEGGTVRAGRPSKNKPALAEEEKSGAVGVREGGDGMGPQRATFRGASGRRTQRQKKGIGGPIFPEKKPPKRGGTCGRGAVQPLDNTRRPSGKEKSASREIEMTKKVKKFV